MKASGIGISDNTGSEWERNCVLLGCLLYSRAVQYS